MTSPQTCFALSSRTVWTGGKPTISNWGGDVFTEDVWVYMCAHAHPHMLMQNMHVSSLSVLNSVGRHYPAPSNTLRLSQHCRYLLHLDFQMVYVSNTSRKHTCLTNQTNIFYYWCELLWFLRGFDLSSCIKHFQIIILAVCHQRSNSNVILFNNIVCVCHIDVISQ